MTATRIVNEGALRTSSAEAFTSIVALFVLGLVLGLGLVHVKPEAFTFTLLSFTSFVPVHVRVLYTTLSYLPSVLLRRPPSSDERLSVPPWT